jgi:hypothetical protein
MKDKFALQIAEAAASLPPDVQLIASDGSKHPAHRLILSAWSPFFKCMFTTRMQEQISGEVQLPDVGCEVLAIMLAWMQEQQVEIEPEPAALLQLMELARRWEISQLSEQLVECEALVLDESNLPSIWEAAERLTLEKLKGRCIDFVLAQVVANKGLTSVLKFLSPRQFQTIMSSDDLPISDEGEAFDLAVEYVEAKLNAETKDVPPDMQDEVLLTVRWRLVPGPTIAQAMLHPLVQQRPKLLPCLADAMQFQLLGGQKDGTPLPASPSGALRTNHRIPLPSYKFLRKGMKVRVIDDAKKLRTLCSRCAPGAQAKVSWNPEMKTQIGKVHCITATDESDMAGQVHSDDARENGWWFPWNALLFA